MGKGNSEKSMKKNEPMSRYTTIRIGGPAKFFIEVEREEKLISIISKARKDKLPYLVIGSGSNLLVHDKGFDGLIIHNKITGINKHGLNVSVKTGTKLGKFIDFLIDHRLDGMQKMIGIPGTVGGAVFGNAGAYGQTVSDYLKKVKVFNGRKSFWIEKKDCKFGYRESIFKKNEYVLLEVQFKFKEGNLYELHEEAERILTIRNKKYPKSLKCPGSFFKNIFAKDLTKDVLSKIPKDKIVFGKIPAGYLLEAVGAKGKKLGRIKIADYHANFFINQGNGKASDFYKLALIYSNKVKKKFGIRLEPEVQLVGFNKKVVVLGLGLEGKDLVNFLIKKDYQITVLDQKEEKELDFAGIDRKEIKLVCGKNYLSGDLSDFDIIFRSPGIYRYKKELIKAEKHGVEISSAIKLFFDLCPGKIIGVTGTKGKGTTSTLIYKILKNSGKDVYLAGNIGKPYLELLPKLKKDSWVILEMSSFQLMDLEKSPHIAVVLNVASDHLDWHKNRDEYVDAKRNVVKHQTKDDFTVVSFDYKTPKSFVRNTKGKVFFFSKSRRVEGSFVRDGIIYLNIGKQKYKIGNVRKLLLRGRHNWENITAAICASRLAGGNLKVIKNTVFSFKGLEHRLELSGKVDGISFYNDSFATGPQPTIAAIKSFDEPITIILGGYDKRLDYDELGMVISERKNVKTVVLIGQTARKIERSIEEAKYKGKILNLKRSKMLRIVKESLKNTPKGGVVVLSPAAASFDMFKNYKDRGNQFKDAIKKMNNKKN